MSEMPIDGDYGIVVINGAIGGIVGVGQRAGGRGWG